MTARRPARIGLALAALVAAALLREPLSRAELGPSGFAPRKHQ